MPIFLLNEHLDFPNPELAEEGIIAVGGDLSSERLLVAYEDGIFPWGATHDGLPIWWTPDPRLMLYPNELIIRKSLRQRIRNVPWEVRFDTNFEAVIRACAAPRMVKYHKDSEAILETGTWIDEDIIAGFMTLFDAGYAHSSETYLDGKLVGGVYGVSLGAAFFGESMFHTEKDASKVALYHLNEHIKKWNFHFIDAQVGTDHLKWMGARNIPRKQYYQELRMALIYPTRRGKWQF